MYSFVKPELPRTYAGKAAEHPHQYGNDEPNNDDCRNGCKGPFDHERDHGPERHLDIFDYYVTHRYFLSASDQ